MADVHGVIEKLVRRPFFWLPDQPLPLVFVVERDGDAFEAARRLAAPFEEFLPHAAVPAGEYGTLRDLVAALAGEQGQLGKPIGGSFLPPPRFPLVQFVLWARRQRDEPPDGDRAGLPGRHWPPDPQSRTGQEEFKDRLKVWRRGRYGGDRGRRTAADFLGRAATTWVPVGTLAAWWLGGSSDLIGLIPWALGVIVAMAGTVVQAMLSIRGSFFNGWFRRQPYLARKPFERLPKYALRLADASEADVERLLVHAMCQDLHQAYQKWIIPWPSWGRGLYGLLVLDATRPGGVNERFLRILEETTEETGLLPPMVVLAAVPESIAPDQRPVTAGRLAELGALTEAWREAARRRVPPLRLLVTASGRPPDDDHRPRLLPSRLRAIGYWCVVALLVIGPVMWLARNQQDRNAHCGGLPWVDRVAGECVGVVNATGPAPRDLFGGRITDLIARIDRNNAVARDSGAYVSVVLFGEYSIRNPLPDDSRLAGALAELTAVEEYQRSVTSTPRLQVLVANGGDDFGQGRRTAELIRALAEEDPHTLGVIGFPRSVKGVEQAIATLHAAKMPMLATTATADRLGYVRDDDADQGEGDGQGGGGGNGGAADSTPGRPSPYYFRMAPTNYRQAVLAARYARRTLLSGVDAPTAVIVQDRSSGDSYTNNLADDYAKAVAGEGIEVSESVYYTVDRGGIAEAASRACARRPDVILYAGRAPEFLGFLNAVEGNDCGPGTVKVLAGDDVIKVVADHGRQIGDLKRVQVYYAALAGRELWRGGAAAPTGFVQNLINGSHANDSEDNLILSYDAVGLFYDAANTAYQGGLPSRGDILYQLALTSGQSAWNGSSGVVDFGDEAHDPVDKAIAIMEVGGSGWGNSKVAARCGRLRIDEPPLRRGICAGLPDAEGPRLPRKSRGPSAATQTLPTTSAAPGTSSMERWAGPT
ncbi:ABC transporter substrate-binding protein [Microbispora sp. RL4-1S]|uniref:ABC transporter substrate-binding protein n=1 Tax=Microbispora oryzae TaxID=2806554 RepID=A0A940WKE6_9ACTN|nr:ABC transporter substrate-binding protein [Microbispora oryzae]MBP2704917.1 ABC transporter substrate-binding protein [Microbispora oryzae]